MTIMNKYIVADANPRKPRPYQAENLQLQRKAVIAGKTKFVTNASVGAGKSQMIADMTKAIMSRWVRKDEKHYAVLVLARQGELIENNSQCCWVQGCRNSIFSASLNSKSTAFPAIFSTEGTFANAIDIEFTGVYFDYLLIDECHQVPIDDEECQYMAIINELLKRNPKMIISGFTGSPYRGMNSIIGDFWEEEIQNISTESLVETGFLVPAHFGFPDSDHQYHYESAEKGVSTTASGERFLSYDQRAANKIAENETLTHQIMADVVHRCKDRKSILIFCSSKKHCKQAAEVLPEGSYGIITDETGYKIRSKILQDAREGKVRYVLNVSCLTTGVDVPIWDTCVFLRPINSIVLLIQGIGRTLRLHDESGKKDALVLDFAGVMERLAPLYDNKFIAKALVEKAKQDLDTYECPQCQKQNSTFARRCECGYWLVKPKICPSCACENDITARDCSACGENLIDWNKALSRKAYKEGEYVPCKEMKLHADGNKLLVTYIIEGERHPFEFFYPFSDKKFCRDQFGRWVHEHTNCWVMTNRVKKMNMASIVKMKAMFSTPKTIAYRISESGKFSVRKSFLSGRESAP